MDKEVDVTWQKASATKKKNNRRRQSRDRAVVAEVSSELSEN